MSAQALWIFELYEIEVVENLRRFGVPGVSRAGITGALPLCARSTVCVGMGGGATHKRARTSVNSVPARVSGLDQVLIYFVRRYLRNCASCENQRDKGSSWFIPICREYVELVASGFPVGNENDFFAVGGELGE